MINHKGCLPVRRKIENTKELGTTPNTARAEICPQCEGRTWEYDYVLQHEVICKRCNGVGKLSPVA